jgi:TPR repeat/BRCA1 C Terminus (BRCT) domain/Tetratricopeptide repeat
MVTCSRRMADTPPFAGQVVTFVGALARLTRRERTALVERQHGRVQASVTRNTTLIVLGEDAAALADRATLSETVPDERRLADARRLNTKHPGRVRIVKAAEFYQAAGIDAPAGAPGVLYSSRTIRGLYPALRDDRLRYLERWGLIRVVRGAGHDRLYSFSDLATLRGASAELAKGASFRAVVRGLVAERQGQLPLDFQPLTGDAQPAKVVALRPRQRAHPGKQGLDSLPSLPPSEQASDLASRYFAEGAELDTGDEEQRDAAMTAYRRALALDPGMTAALVNLANVHYARDEIVEAEALYEKACAIDPTCFEGHFNLGNVHHDTGRFELAVRCYTKALRLDPAYAEAHFYLAVTLEKLGRSGEARPHWVAYQKLAPNGEWVELAREFSD